MPAVAIQAFSFVIVALAAFAIYRIVNGGSADHASLTRLERAEKRLESAAFVAQSLFLVSVLIKFAIRLEWLGPDFKPVLFAIIIPFLVSVAIYLKARFDVMRASMAKS